MSERPRTAAPPRVAISSASRAVIHSLLRSGSEVESRVCGPSGGSRPMRSRASSIAWRASSRMFDASLLADPSTPSPTRTPAARYCLTGAMPEASRMFEQGQCATPTAGPGELTDLVVVDVYGVGEPDVVAKPAHRLHPRYRPLLEVRA